MQSIGVSTQTEMKKGISPLIATVLIMGFTVVLAMSIFLWGSDFLKSMQKMTQEQALKSITCTSDVGFTIKNACVEGGIGIRLLVESYGVVNIESFNARITGNKGASSNKVPQTLEASGIKLLTTSYDSEETGTIEKIELIPTIIYQGEEVVCSNVNEKITEFSCGQLSELQILACTEADAGRTCDKLDDIGLITKEDCCEKLPPNCPEWCPP